MSTPTAVTMPHNQSYFVSRRSAFTIVAVFVIAVSHFRSDAHAAEESAKSKSPNIVLILADDK